MSAASPHDRVPRSAGAPKTIQHALQILGVLLALPLAALGAEASGGRIERKVFNLAPDGERAFIPAADVVLSAAPGAHPLGQPEFPARKTTSGASGEFSFDDIPMGCYRVTATSTGLTGQGKETCLLAQGAQITLDIEMNLATVVSSVEVSSKIDGVETTESSSTATIGTASLQTAPSLTEQFDDFLPLLPGVIRGPNDTINMKGARAAQSSTLVNNTSATDPYTGALAINVPIDAISSVKVLSNPYDSEYGNFAGAISTVDTKISDFAKFHYDFHNLVPGLKRREDHWAGIEKFLPRLTVTQPLVRNRIALTQSFEYRYNRPEIKKANLPPLHDDTKLESFSSFTRVDFQITNRHTAAINLSFFPQKLNYVGLDTFTPQESTANLRQRGYMLGGEDQYVFPSGALIESRASYKTFDLDVRTNSASPYRRGLDTTLGSSTGSTGNPIASKIQRFFTSRRSRWGTST
jgi:outer membrane receptor protein involved in Fe transport